MKVLVVEGNIVMMEIISDVLSVDGFTVTTAISANDAETKFGTFVPEVVVFDIDTKGANIISFINSIKKTENVRIIAICNSRSDAPSHPAITDYIVKPFKGSEVLMAVRKAKNDIETRNKKARKFSTIFGGLFSGPRTIPKPSVSQPKPEPQITQPEPEPQIVQPEPEPQMTESQPQVQPQPESKPDVKPRQSHFFAPKKAEKTVKSYIVFEDYPNKVYDVAKKLLASDSRLFILTQDRIMSVRNKFQNANVTVVGLSRRAKEGYITYSKIGSIMGELGEFTKSNVNGIVVVEGVEIMIENHGMSTVVTMMCQLVDNGYENGTVFLFSAKPQTFSQNEKSLLLHHLDFYSEATEDDRR